MLDGHVARVGRGPRLERRAGAPAPRVCEIGKLCYSRFYIVGADRSISARMSDGTILIARRRSEGCSRAAPLRASTCKVRSSATARAPRPSAASTSLLRRAPRMKAVVHSASAARRRDDDRGDRPASSVHPRIIVPSAASRPRTSARRARGVGRVDPPDRQVLGHAGDDAHGSVTMGTNLLDA